MQRIYLPIKRPYSWKVFFFLLVLLIPATFAIIPFSLTLTGTTLEPGQGWLLVLQILVSILIYGLLAGIGLLLAARIGLGLPFVESWLEKNPIEARFRDVLSVAILVGVVVGIVIIGLDKFGFSGQVAATIEELGISISEDIKPPAWQGLLAAFSAGVTEEVIFRLFGLTLLAWLGSFINRDSEGRPSLLVFWIANILIAVSFGLAHLPATAAVGLPLNTLIISRAIILNGIGGLAFGWLYWTLGLESAIIAHFSADIVLHVILVLVAPLLS